MALFSYQNSLASLPNVYADVKFSGVVETKGIPIVFSIHGCVDVNENGFLEHFISKLETYHKLYPDLPFAIFLTLDGESDISMLSQVSEIRKRLPGCSIEVIAMLDCLWDDYLRKQLPERKSRLEKFRKEISSVYVLDVTESHAHGDLSRAAYIAYFSNVILFLQNEENQLNEFNQHIYNWKTGAQSSPFSARAITLSEGSQGYVEIFRGISNYQRKFSPDTTEETLASTLEHVNEFNQAAKNVNESNREAVVKSESYVHKAFTELSPYIVRTFATADVLATHYQKKRFQFMKYLIFAAICSILSWEMYGGLTSQWRFFALALFASGYCIASILYITIIQRSKMDNYFLDARSLAEAMRVQMQWILIGSPLITSEWYLRKQTGDMRWIQFALTSIQAMTARNHSLSDKECIEVSYRQWVQKQRQYFNKSAIPKNYKKIEFLDKIIKNLLIFGVFLIVVQLTGFYFDTIRNVFLTWLIPMTALVPTAAGLINAYIEQEAMRDQINLYYSMSAFFERGENAINKILNRNEDPTENDLNEARHILEELGKESLEENSQWLILRRERPLQVFS